LGVSPSPLTLFDLPVRGRLWPKLDVGDIRIAVCLVRSRGPLLGFSVLTTCGFLLAPLDEGLLSFAFRSGRSSVSGHAASSAYTTEPLSRQC
jgi:hypothetical protein